MTSTGLCPKRVLGGAATARWRLVIPRAIGLLLLVAAAIKAQGLGVAPVNPMGVFSAAGFQVALILVEVSLGFWLLSGAAPLGSWLLALVTFVGFTAFSFWQGLVGQSSCGCFGRLSISPWYALGMDVVIVSGLLIAYPNLHPVRQNPRLYLKAALYSIVRTTAGIAILAGILLASVHIAFGSVSAAIAYFRGERISIDPQVVDVGAGQAEEWREVSIRLTNWTDHPIKVLGGTASCSCTVLADLPLTIPARHTREVNVQVHFRGSRGIFTRKAAFLVSAIGIRRLDFIITGTLTSQAKSRT